MSLDWESIWSWFRASKAIWWCVAILLAIILFFYVATKISEEWNESRIEKAKKQVNNLIQEATNINTTINNLRVQEVEKQAEVNAAKANLNAIRKETDELQEIANQAVNNANAVNDRDFNGTSFDNANAARCRAFPDSPECRR